MTDHNQDKEKQNQQSHSNSEEGNIHGRLDHTANPEFNEEENRPDISHVDRQEGTMNNGELGGNFSKDAKENT